MRNEQNERVASDRNQIKNDEHAPMSPKIGKYSAGISVNRAEQRPQRVVETDDKNPRAERLQIFRYKAHPQFLARANYENGDEQNDEIASKAEKIRELPGATYILRVRRLHSHSRMRRRYSNYKEQRPTSRSDPEIALPWRAGALRRESMDLLELVPSLTPD